MDPTRCKTRTPVKLKRTPVKLKPGKAELLIEPEDKESLGYCRLLMGERYVHSRVSVSVRDLVALPEFSHVSVKQADYWCNHDKWVERRRDLHEEVRQRVTAQIITDMTQERIEHLKRLVALRTSFDNVGMVVNEQGIVEFKLQPKSLEAWVTAKVKLDQHISKIQTQVSSEIPQIAAEAVVSTERPTNLPLSLKPRLTEEESLDLALRLRDKRMQEDEATVVRWKASQQLPAPQSEPQEPKPKKKPPPGAQ